MRKLRTQLDIERWNKYRDLLLLFVDVLLSLLFQ